MEDLYLYFEDMMMGPDGERVYNDILRLQEELNQMLYLNDMND
jgi:hypothetical protein